MLVGGALIGSCPATRSPVAQAPGSVSPGAAGSKDHALLAANASMYVTFRPGDAGRPDRAPLSPSLEPGLFPLEQMFGIDLRAADTIARLGVDAQRPTVLSMGIVDPKRLSDLLASPTVPPEEASFSVRSALVVPVVDMARALAALPQVMDAAKCVPPRADADRWARWLGRLEGPADRRSAETSDAAYLCASELGAAVVRLNIARRELRWVAAVGDHAPLTAASGELAPEPALSDRLEREHFFSERAAAFSTPAAGARLIAATGLIKTRAGLAGITPEQRPVLWRKGARELGASQRLVESPPVSISELLITDQGSSWTLTKEGRELISPLAGRQDLTLKDLRGTIAARLKPGGVFADPAILGDTLHEAGDMAPALVIQFLWPHAIAFDAAHPGDAQLLAASREAEAAKVDIDVARGRVSVAR